MRLIFLSIFLFLFSMSVMAKDIIDDDRVKVVISGKYKIGAMFFSKPKVTVLSYDSPALKRAFEDVLRKNEYDIGEMPPYGTKISSGDIAADTALTLSFEYKGFAEDYKPQGKPKKLDIGGFIIDLGVNYLLNRSINPIAFSGNNAASVINSIVLTDFAYVIMLKRGQRTLLAKF